LIRSARSVERLALVVLLPAAACRAGADHERMGDRRYAEGRYVDALAEYRLAMRQRGTTPERQSKLALAALHAGALEEAARTFRDLARRDAAAGPEAVEGLMRTARAALASNDVEALREALAAIREIAPARPLAGLGAAAQLVASPEAGAVSREVLLTAAAAAGNRAAADSLLLRYGAMDASAGRCDLASLTFESVLRRTPPAPLALEARAGLAGCTLDVGRRLLGVGQLEEAEAAFRQAVELGVPDSVVRMAWVLIGDTRWAAGDTTGALAAYSAAMEGGDSDDPIVRRADEQRRRLLGNPTTP
jgi:tetratricopeptide (TPR) repeat protein